MSKLFYYNAKNEQVICNLDLGTLSEQEKEVVEKMIDFVEENLCFNSWKRLCLAETVETVINEEGEPELFFK